jgi:hypothetical protein
MSMISKLTWINQLLTDFHLIINSSMKLFCDNQTACYITCNLVFHERIKHIKINCHFIHKKLQIKEINTSFIKNEDQLVDVFTKSLEPTLRYFKYEPKCNVIK